jgi:hypothetical protein
VTSRWLVILLASLSLAGLGLGCGDDTPATPSSSNAASSDPAGPLSPAQFAAKATEICDEARQKYLSEAPEALLEILDTPGISRRAAEAKLIRVVLAGSLQEKVDKVRALGIPEGDEKQVEDILSAIEDVARKARTEPAIFIFEQAHFKHPFYRARFLADKYDIGHCARA